MKIIIFFLVFLFLTFQQTLHVEANDFKQWVKDFKKRALDQNISPETVNSVMDKAIFLTKVIEYDRFQPEFYEDTFTYINKRVNKQKVKKSKILKGRTIFNLFFEDSTRTRTSFEVAAKRLSADLINVAVKDSSINNGETLLDTMTTITSMNPDVLVISPPEEGISTSISERVDACVINVGDVSYEHPTQASLDALTIKTTFNTFPPERKWVSSSSDMTKSNPAR